MPPRWSPRSPHLAAARPTAPGPTSSNCGAALSPACSRRWTQSPAASQVRCVHAATGTAAGQPELPFTLFHCFPCTQIQQYPVILARPELAEPAVVAASADQPTVLDFSSGNLAPSPVSPPPPRSSFSNDPLLPTHPAISPLAPPLPLPQQPTNRSRRPSSTSTFCDPGWCPWALPSRCLRHSKPFGVTCCPCLPSDVPALS